jgi:hypothetical protein
VVDLYATIQQRELEISVADRLWCVIQTDCVKTRSRMRLAQYRCVQKPVRESLLQFVDHGRINLPER